MKKALVWLRDDLRLRDNPALHHACEHYDAVLIVYILDDETPQTENYGDRRIGGAQRWWLHHSLSDLKDNIEKHGGTFILRRGQANTVVQNLVDEWEPQAVLWNRRYTPWGINHDKNLKSKLQDQNIAVQSFKANLLMEPWEVQTKTGGNYGVYTPFWKNIRPRIMQELETPLDIPQLKSIEDSPASDTLNDWGLLPTQPDWSGGFNIWSPGEDNALKRLDRFIDQAAAQYDEQRDQPSVEGTSRLSPHLAFGEISPRLIWYKLRFALESASGNTNAQDNIDVYLSEIAWREFAYHLLFHHPQTINQPLKDKYNKVPWIMNEDMYQKWCKGQTGIPIIDAGMRQLLQTGWMHNRVRMLVGSFLVKNCLIPWQAGENWFWDTLVDADQASNVMGWQWVAGSGADAAPYFRVFNPVTQGERFDSNGDYIREFVPELSGLPNQYIHKPWEAPEDVLREARIKLGTHYPKPLVDLKTSRQAALDAYAKMKESS